MTASSEAYLVDNPLDKEKEEEQQEGGEDMEEDDDNAFGLGTRGR